MRRARFDVFINGDTTICLKPQESHTKAFVRYISKCFIGHLCWSLLDLSSLLKQGSSYFRNFGINGNLLRQGLIYIRNSGINRDLLKYDYNQKDLAANRKVLDEWNKETKHSVSSINWFIPDYRNIYKGGIFTVFRFIDFFSRKGITSRIILSERPYHPSSEGIISELTRVFPEAKNTEVVENPRIPYADISIATFWPTAYALLKFVNTHGKYYFIQDYEPLFYPAGSWYGLAERTYTFGFLGITNGPSLKELYERQYNTQAEYFTPAVDTSLFKPAEDAPRPKIKRVFFYARPQNERNAFDLGILALEKIKAKYRHIEVVTAGWNLSRYRLPFSATNLGVLSQKQTAKLYRYCDVGISFMFTKHPSYIPLELMASGCLVISNKNSANLWLLKHGYNCLLSEPTPSSILETFELALEDYELRKSIYRNALKTIESLSWEKEMERIYNFILGN